MFEQPRLDDAIGNLECLEGRALLSGSGAAVSANQTPAAVATPPDPAPDPGPNPAPDPGLQNPAQPSPTTNQQLQAQLDQLKQQILDDQREINNDQQALDDAVQQVNASGDALANLYEQLAAIDQSTAEGAAAAADLQNAINADNDALNAEEAEAEKASDALNQDIQDYNNDVYRYNVIYRLLNPVLVQA